jgi:hypothetical protein
MASAKRAMALRQRARRRNKMAEISVPAWPMPTQKTKLMMPKPHATGRLLPQVPMPKYSVQPMQKVPMASAVMVTARATYQARGGRCAGNCNT